MTFRGFVSRAELGLRPPRSVSYNITPEDGGSAGHWTGPAPTINSHADCIRTWVGFQKYHMDVHGWVDIAYTMGVCQHGYALAGRGAGVRTAANGTNYGNQNFYAICWIGGKGMLPTWEAMEAFWWAVENLRKQGNAGNMVKKHSDFKSTACPGTLGPEIDKGPTQEAIVNERYDETSNKWFQEAYNWAVDAGIFTDDTMPSDDVSAEKLAVFLKRLHDKVRMRPQPHTHKHGHRQYALDDHKHNEYVTGSDLDAAGVGGSVDVDAIVVEAVNEVIARLQNG